MYTQRIFNCQFTNRNLNDSCEKLADAAERLQIALKPAAEWLQAALKPVAETMQWSWKASKDHYGETGQLVLILLIGGLIHNFLHQNRKNQRTVILHPGSFQLPLAI